MAGQLHLDRVTVSREQTSFGLQLVVLKNLVEVVSDGSSLSL